MRNRFVAKGSMTVFLAVLLLAVSGCTSNRNVSSETSTQVESTETESQYVPQEKAIITPIEPNEEFSVSDSTGMLKVKEEDDYSVTVILEFNYQLYGVEKSCWAVTSSYLIERGDAAYIFLTCHYENSYGRTYLYKVEDGQLEAADALNMIFFEPFTNVDQLNMATTVNSIGTYEGHKTYRIENDKFVTDDEVYIFNTIGDESKSSLTVIKDLPAKIAGKEMTLTPGTVIHPYGQDEDTFFFETDDGRMGQFQYEHIGQDKIDSYGYEYGIGGHSANDYFETVPYSG